MSSNNAQALIQKLLHAEQEAEEIVSRARENRTKRLREARSAAESEISAFRVREDERFVAEQAARSRTAEDQTQRDSQTAAVIASVRAAAHANGARTSEYLVAKVLAVEPRLSNIQTAMLKAGAL
jgi:V-type H+-transporting ATPase subunit G